MISTFHGDEQSMFSDRNPRLKPNMILEYNKRKKRHRSRRRTCQFLFSNQKDSYMVQKIAVEVLFGVALINSIHLYNKLNPSQKCSILHAQTEIAKKQHVPTNVLRSQQSSSNVSSSSREPIPAQHFLQDLKNKRRKCAGCYNIHHQNGETPKANNKAKKVSTICNTCLKPYCLSCFTQAHTQRFSFFLSYLLFAIVPILPYCFFHIIE